MNLGLVVVVTLIALSVYFAGYMHGKYVAYGRADQLDEIRRATGQLESGYLWGEEGFGYACGYTGRPEPEPYWTGSFRQQRRVSRGYAAGKADREADREPRCAPYLIQQVQR